MSGISIPNFINESYKGSLSPHSSFPSSQYFDEIPIKSMNVQERTGLWKEFKEKKMEEIRKNNQGKGLEECTFKPQLHQTINRNMLKTSNSLTNLQTMNSIQKYIYRMNKVRETKDLKIKEEQAKTGSGK